MYLSTKNKENLFEYLDKGSEPLSYSEESTNPTQEGIESHETSTESSGTQRERDTLKEAKVNEDSESHVSNKLLISSIGPIL